MMLHWPLNEIATHSAVRVYRVDEIGQKPSKIPPFQWGFKERNPDFASTKTSVYDRQCRMQADLSITNHYLCIMGNVPVNNLESASDHREHANNRR